MFDREGRFKATPIEWGVDTKPSGVVKLAMKFNVFALLHEGEWVDFTAEETGYFNLILKNGSLAEKNVENLMAALGWNGSGPASLQDGDWSQCIVQLTVKYKPESTGPEGQTYPAKFEIAFINPENWEGLELKKLDASAIKALDAKFGAKFRAMAKPAAAAPARVPPRAPVKPAAPVTDETVNEPGANDGADEAPAEVAAPAPARRAPPPRRAPATAGPKAYG